MAITKSVLHNTTYYDTQEVGLLAISVDRVPWNAVMLRDGAFTKNYYLRLITP